MQKVDNSQVFKVCEWLNLAAVEAGQQVDGGNLG
jgi:hypothetical protein